LTIVLEQTRSPVIGAGKLDSGLDAFAARAGKKYFGQSLSGALTKTFGQFARQFWNVTLQHDGAAPLQLIHDGGHHLRVVVANIVNAVPGKKIENATTVPGE